MCVLVVCRLRDSRFPLLVAANREEDPERPTSPPGVHAVDGRRVLCPMDRRHGGTWIGVNDVGLVAALTNWEHATVPEQARSRGGATLTALGAGSLDAAVAAVERHAAAGPIRPFQLVLADASRAARVLCADGETRVTELESQVLTVTNRHGPGELELAGMASWLAGCETGPDDVESWLDHLVVTLATGRAMHMASGETVPVCVEQGTRRTVSGTLLAVPRAVAELAELRLRYCFGSPRASPFRNYSGLVRRLL